MDVRRVARRPRSRLVAVAAVAAVSALLTAGCRGPQQTIENIVPITCYGSVTSKVPFEIDLPTWVMAGENLKIGPVVGDQNTAWAWELQLTIPGATPSTIEFNNPGINSTDPGNADTPQYVRLPSDAAGSVDVRVSDANPGIDGVILDCTADSLFASIPVRPRPTR